MSTSAPAAARSLVTAFGARVRQRPERAAVVGLGRTLSYGELWRAAHALSRRLSAAGVGPGDRVLLPAGGGDAGFVVGYLATHLARAVAVPVDASAPLARRARIAELSRPRVVVGSRAEGALDLPTLEALDGDATPADAETLPEPPADAVADILFTTGTSGQPKGVVLTHGNVLSAAEHINAVIGNGDGDVEVVPLPLSHSFGLGRLRCNLIAGGTLVLTQGFKLPGEIFAALKQHRATGLAGVPAGFNVLLRFGARGLGAFAEQLRYVEIGSAAMPLERKLELMQFLPKTRLFMHYGLTEASRSAFLEFHADRERLMTVGRPAPGVEIEVRDENGRRCAPDERGSLWIRGRHVAKEYWQDPERSASGFVGGWVHTDDVASLAADGCLSLHGRRDDMINVGGFNVSPDEVERVLETHPAIAEAACIGVADPKGIAGQVVRAYLVAAREAELPSAAELQTFTAAALELYKVPTEYRWTATLPRTASGKLQRAVLRAQASEPSAHD